MHTPVVGSIVKKYVLAGSVLKLVISRGWSACERVESKIRKARPCQICSSRLDPARGVILEVLFCCVVDELNDLALLIDQDQART